MPSSPFKEPRLRPAEPADLATIARIHREAFFAAMPHMPDLHTPEEDLAFYTTQVFPNCEMRLAECDGVVAGFIAWWPGWINHLYLLPAFQRQGLGRLLLAQAKADQAELRLWAFQCNTRARCFYEKHGFIPELETDGSGNDERQPDILYRWRRGAEEKGVLDDAPERSKTASP